MVNVRLSDNNVVRTYKTLLRKSGSRLFWACFSSNISSKLFLSTSRNCKIDFQTVVTSLFHGWGWGGGGEGQRSGSNYKEMPTYSPQRKRKIFLNQYTYLWQTHSVEYLDCIESHISNKLHNLLQITTWAQWEYSYHPKRSVWQ